MKIKIKIDCSVSGSPVKAGCVLEVGADVSSSDARTLKSFGLAEDHKEIERVEEFIQPKPEPDDFDEDDEPEPDDELADDAEPEASEDEEAAEAAVEEPELTEDPLTVALEETPVAAVASVNKTKKGSKK